MWPINTHIHKVVRKNEIKENVIREEGPGLSPEKLPNIDIKVPEKETVQRGESWNVYFVKA